MHKYLRAIGFSELKDKKDLQKLTADIIVNADERAYTSNTEDTVLAVFSKDFAENTGISVCGEFDSEDNFSYEYCFPYLRGNGISSEEDVSIEHHISTESYAGVCDDIKVGISLIFYLQNMIPYVKAKNSGQLPITGSTLTLSALSIQGTIMMPINKNEKDKKTIKKASNNRNSLIAAARKGDEDAIENLTLEDMDTYTAISKRIQKEDVFSLVDTYFMPYGVECDEYSVLGEIVDCSKIINRITGEELYQMGLVCNDLPFDICINKKDVYGEPEVGRRFKGVIWMQGRINLPE